MNEMSFFNKDIMRFEIYLIKIGFEVIYFVLVTMKRMGFLLLSFCL